MTKNFKNKNRKILTRQKRKLLSKKTIAEEAMLSVDQMAQLMAQMRAMNAKSFADLSTRFNGSRKLHKVEEFISRTTIYKDMNGIADKDDVIEESESPYAAPVVLIGKKDGGTRVCIDYRKLNNVTTPDRYPLPRIDDLLHEAKSSKYMSTLDLRSGYWQIQVAESDREKTAFVTPFGMYEFKRMPFGLRNAPATFQRLMDRFKNSIPEVPLLVYLDDLIIMSQTYEEHLLHLSVSFKNLEKYGLRAHRDKCRFVCSEVKYLGHKITKHGLKMDNDKIKAITDLAPPTNIKNLLSFIQTCSWYRRFIPNFAKEIQPLTKLTRKNQEFTWSEEQQAAHDKRIANNITNIETGK